MRLYKRGKTWWVAYFDATAKTTIRRSTRCTDRLAADTFARRLERDGADPDRAAAEETTLSGALDALMAEYELLVKEGKNSSATHDFYLDRSKQLLRMIAEGHLPERLSDLRAQHVDKMIDTRREEGSSRSTISKDLLVLKMALKMAKRRGRWLGEVDRVMPARFVTGAKPRKRTLTQEELWKLFGALPSSHHAGWVAFAVATGANFSEAAKAERDDVTKGYVHLRGTKREARDRQVPIVRPWQRALLDVALSVGGRPKLHQGWTKQVRDLQAACLRAKIAKCSSNDLRRTFATWMRADGARLEDLAPVMGHADSRMLERVYARQTPEALSKLIADATGSKVAEAEADPAVLILYGTGTDQTSSAHSTHTVLGGICPGFGSDCRTRTCDPVINSQGDSGRIPGGWESACVGFVRLRECVVQLKSLWDLADAIAESAREELV